MLAYFLRSIADYTQRVGRQVPEQVVEVAVIERTTWDVVRRVGDDRGEIDVQRREHPFQMVGAGVEVLRIDVGIDRLRHIPGEGRDEFDVRQPHRTCGLRRPSTRHPLADCCSNTLSPGHGLPPWLEWVADLHFVYTKNHAEARKKCTQKKGAASRAQLRRNDPNAAFFRDEGRGRRVGPEAARRTITIRGTAAAG